MKKTDIAVRLRSGAAPFIVAAALLSPSVASAQQDDEGQPIVVTGSRIARPDLEQSSPISVISNEVIKFKGSANIENVLNDLPQVTGDTTSASNNPGGGVATVNLRNLGAQRTLVLVNGRRYLSYDTSQIVDLNTVPTALIERVDVVTGGRSAVYGSDAIAGVVNFVLKKDFEGVQLDGNTGLSSRGDGKYWDMSGTVGHNFGDGRGNITAHVGYTKRYSLFAGSRSYTRNAMVDNNDGTFFYGGSSSVPQGRAKIGDTTYSFDSAGNASVYDPASDSYNYAPANYLQVPQQRFIASVSANYEVSDAFKPYVEAQFVHNKVSNELAPTPLSNGTPFGTGADAGSLGAINLHVYSPFFSSATQSMLAAQDTDGDGYVTANSFGFRTVGIGARHELDDRKAYRFVAGATGDLGGGWNYDAYYMRAHTKNVQSQSGNVNLTNFLSAITTGFKDPVTGVVSGLPNGGELVCANEAAGCVPANMFGLGNLSTDAANYLAVDAVNREKYTSQVASAVLTNSSIADLGAGGIGIALGAEYRKEKGSTDPDLILATGNVGGFNPQAPTTGSYHVFELFAETNVPLLADKPGVEKLELNGAARYSDYSNAVGKVFTWSAGLMYEPIKGISFRGQYQRAIRGPSVYELYLGQTVSFDGVNDPCSTSDAAAAGALHDRCLAGGVPASQIGNSALSDLANPPTVINGNADLREEKSKTWTIGAVLAPTLLRGFSATVDFYNIDITGYISRLGQSNLFQACYVYGLSDYCSGITRNADGEVERIVDTNLNSGGLKTRGIDVSASYTLPLGGETQVKFDFMGTRLIKWDFTPIMGVSLVNKCAGRFGNSCGNPTPKWKHVFRTTVSSGPVLGSIAWRYIGSVKDDDDASTYYLEKIKAYNYFDASLAVTIDKRFTLSGGVNNMFDKKPPLGASSQNYGNVEQSNTYPAVYDVIGRYMFVGASVKF